MKFSKVFYDSTYFQVYLRSWSKEVGCPIFSVDYSFAPQHPFPRQLEEAFFAYCWARKNHTQLGKREAHVKGFPFPLIKQIIQVPVS